MKEKEKKIQVQPPLEKGLPTIGNVAENSAGIKGVLAGLMHVKKYMKAGVAWRTMFKLNQKGGIDCPGCAWPDPDDDRSKLGEYCENGMKAIAEEATRKSIGATFFKQHSIQELSERSDFELGKFGRLAEPMVLVPDGTHYEPISWEAAFSLIGEELRALESPDEAIFYTSGRTSNEAAFLYQLFVRQYGTNNMPDCSNMCHESSGSGLSQTVGIGKGSVTLQDLHEAELIIVMGQNPGTNHPRMLSALEKCKEGGGKIIAVNPLPEAGLTRFTNPQSIPKMLSGGTKLSDLHLPVAINGDIALLKAIMLLLWEEEQKAPGTIFDLDFISEHTAGYSEFMTHLQSHNLTTCIQNSGVDEGLIRKAVEMITTRKKIIICWAMGLTQHENGVQNIREIVNLLLLKGAIGKPGAGTCPVRGHSNVQGDRTMGIWESPPADFLDRLEKHFKFKAPREHGFGVVEAIEAMYKGQSSVFIGLGGNFISATPDTEYTAEALQSCSLTVQISTKLNRSHLVHGKKALILPCLGRTDLDIQNKNAQFVTVENSMGVVHSSQGILKPQSKHQLSEPAIIAGIAQATLGSKSTVDWNAMISSYDNIRDAIEACIPGFQDFNKRVRNASGFYLPNGARERSFNTESGKANFSGNELPKNELRKGEFTMMTIRSHDQYNTTIYGLDDRYRGIRNGRRVVLVNEYDLESSGLKAGMYVDIVGVYRGKKRVAKKFLTVVYPIPSRCIATYFPEANVLVPIDSYDRISKTPASKRVVVKMIAHREV